MVWFLLMETETVPMGWALYEPMMPAAQGLDTRSWLGGRCCFFCLLWAASPAVARPLPALGASLAVMAVSLKRMPSLLVLANSNKAASGISPKRLSWIGVEVLCFQGCCRVLPMSHDVSAELSDSQYLHNQANGGKNAHHHNGEA